MTDPEKMLWVGVTKQSIQDLISGINALSRPPKYGGLNGVPVYGLREKWYTPEKIPKRFWTFFPCLSSRCAREQFKRQQSARVVNSAFGYIFSDSHYVSDELPAVDILDSIGGAFLIRRGIAEKIRGKLNEEGLRIFENALALAV